VYLYLCRERVYDLSRGCFCQAKASLGSFQLFQSKSKRDVSLPLFHTPFRLTQP
jgi:hypothetical protein